MKRGNVNNASDVNNERWNYDKNRFCERKKNANGRVRMIDNACVIPAVPFRGVSRRNSEKMRLRKLRLASASVYPRCITHRWVQARDSTGLILDMHVACSLSATEIKILFLDKNFYLFVFVIPVCFAPSVENLVAKLRVSRRHFCPRTSAKYCRILLLFHGRIFNLRTEGKTLTGQSPVNTFSRLKIAVKEKRYDSVSDIPAEVTLNYVSTTRFPASFRAFTSNGQN